MNLNICSELTKRFVNLGKSKDCSMYRTIFLYSLKFASRAFEKRRRSKLGPKDQLASRRRHDWLRGWVRALDELQPIWAYL